MSQTSNNQEGKAMEMISTTKNELITLLNESRFDHLSRTEQVRLRDYLTNIVVTLQEVSDRGWKRRSAR
jgi:hypothetical protein